MHEGGHYSHRSYTSLLIANKQVVFLR